MNRDNETGAASELGNLLAGVLSRAIVEALRSPSVREEFSRVVRTEVDTVAKNLISSGARSRTMTVSEASQFAGVTEGTIRDWIRKKKLGALKAGNRFRIRQEDLERSMTDRETSQAINVEREAARIVSFARRKRPKEGL